MKFKKEEVKHVHPYEIAIIGKTIDVTVKYLDEELMTAMRKKCMETKWVNHVKTEDLNIKKTNQLLIDEGLQDISNLTPYTLKYLIEPTVKIELDEGTTWDTPCKFGPEIKAVIKENINFSFFSFLQDKCRDAEALVNAQEAGGQENLGHSSGTAKDLS